MRPGYVDLPPPRGKLKAHFNEAGAHAPRIPRIRDRGTPGEGHFNEAGAHAPRIPVVDERDHPPLLHFNEAGAHAPRILLGLSEGSSKAVVELQ